MDDGDEMPSGRKAARNSKITGAPGVMPLGPLQLLVRAPTPADLLTLRKWIKSAWRDRVKGSPLPPGITSEELKGLSAEDRALVLRGYGERKALSPERRITEDEAFDILCSPDGVALMVYLSAKKHAPGVTLNEIRAQITEENVDAVNEAFGEACAPEGDDGNPDAFRRGPNTFGPSTSHEWTDDPISPARKAPA